MLRTSILSLLFLISAPIHATGNKTDDTFRVTLLGTGTPVSGAQRFGASVLVEAGARKYVFDCGRGCGIRLQQRLGVRNLSTVDTLFLTHLHSDHTVGIPEVYMNGWLLGRSKPFRVFGPDRTREMMLGLRNAYGPDVDIRRIEEVAFGTPERMAAAETTAHDITPGVVLEEHGVRILAFEVDHRHVIPAFGYRIDYQGRSVVISGDTAPSDNLIKHAKGTDLIIHEVMSPQLVRRLNKQYKDNQKIVRFIVDIHTLPLQAARIFKQVQPQLAVYYHTNVNQQSGDELLALTAEHYTGKVVIGEDLMIINVGEAVTVVP